MNNYKQSGDENLLVIFDQNIAVNAKQSLAQEKPVVIKNDYVTFTDRSTGKVIIRRKVKENQNENDILRFPEQWDKYKNNQKQDYIGDGLTIDQLPGITKEQAVICKHLKLFTIEQVANITDIGIKRLGSNGRALVEACKKYSGGTGALEKKLDAQDDVIKQLQEEIAALNIKKTRRRKKEVIPDEPIDDNTESSPTGEGINIDS